jgi:mono/diheme cytochrome c family protein
MKRRPGIFPKTGNNTALSLAICLGFVVVASTDGFGQAKPKPTSIEEKTKIHRLATTKRAVYDAFTYLNRIPEKAEEGEEVLDFTARVYSRLANQEGRILIKLPPGMNSEAYLGYKTFLSTDADTSNGNCVVCHAPEKFTDLKNHALSEGGKALPTPSLRNMSKRKVDISKALRAKLLVSEKPGASKDYQLIKLNKADLKNLEAFLKQLNDVDDKIFRELIIQAKVLDTSQN